MTACVSFFSFLHFSRYVLELLLCYIFKKYNMYFVEICNNTLSDFVAQKR